MVVVGMRPPLPYVFHASKVAPKKFDGGSTKVIDHRQFPGTSLSALIIDLEPGALREIHWHPDADELARHSEPGAPNFGYPPQRAAQQSGSRYGQSDLHLASSEAKGDQAFAFAGQNSNTAANSVTWFESGATRLSKPM